MKLFNRIGSSLPIKISLCIAAVFFGLGAMAFFWAAPQQSQALRQLQSLPSQNAAQFTAAPAGEEVILTGNLSQNRSLVLDGLVAYASQHWAVSRDTDNQYKGTWETDTTVTPVLSLKLSDGVVRLAGSDKKMPMDGSQHATLIETAVNDQIASGIPDGSIRLSGYMNGDRLTVVGKKGDQNELIPEQYYGGERQALESGFSSGALLFRIIGLAFMGLAPVMVWFGFLADRGTSSPDQRKKNNHRGI